VTFGFWTLPPGEEKPSKKIIESFQKIQKIQENYTDLSKKSENSKNSRKLW
jgi:hypothetical protein